jgi:hypothetical protein
MMSGMKQPTGEGDLVDDDAPEGDCQLHSSNVTL